MLTRTIAMTCAAFVAAPALAQSNIDPAHKYAWSENCGWTNWADAGSPPGLQGALFTRSFASGFVWVENVGWLNLGDGAPNDGVHYANTTGSDFGINISPDGALSGFAWAENIGWINFSGGAMASPPNPARLDAAADRLRGYAWGENTGWLNLDHATHYVGVSPELLCDPDVNCDGVPDQGDVACIILAVAGDMSCFCQADPDFNRDGVPDQGDVADLMLVVAGAPCP